MSLLFDHTTSTLKTTDVSKPLILSSQSGCVIPLTADDSEHEQVNGAISISTGESAPLVGDDNRLVYRSDGSFKRCLTRQDIIDIKDSFSVDAQARFDTINSRIEVLEGQDQLPIGLIACWRQDTIPPGWARCNGSTVNGIKTPDLRDRFVPCSQTLSTSGSYKGTNPSWSNIKINDYGGENSHRLTTSQIPEHKHVVPWGEKTLEGGPWGYWNNTGLNNSGNTNYGTHGGSDQDNIWRYTSPSGSNNSHNNMPRFYSLIYIMFVG